jgi:hypothetical protein
VAQRQLSWLQGRGKEMSGKINDITASAFLFGAYCGVLDTKENLLYYYPTLSQIL